MASWPTSIPTDATLYIAVNELQTNLSTGVNTVVTTLTLNSTTSFPTVGLVLIDNEIIKYTGVSGSDLTGCTRAFDGTTVAAHSAGAIVSFAICANHHNVTKDEIIALATYLSNNLGTGSQPLSNGSRALASNGSGKIIESSVTSTELSYLSGVSSAIQTQLGLLAPKSSPTFTGTITTPLTANRAVATGASGVLAASSVTDTELSYLSGVTSAIQTQINAVSFPSGAMVDFGGTVAPAGWIACDGSSLLRAGTYATLFAAIGTTWGSVDGTHFTLPNFQRRVAVGSGGSGTGTLGNAVGNTGGEETHVLTTAELASHTHTQNAHNHTATDSGHTHGVGVVTNNGVNGANPFGVSSVTSNGTKTSNSGTASITVANATAVNNNAGSDTAHNNMQPSAVVLKIIKI